MWTKQASLFTQVTHSNILSWATTQQTCTARWAGEVYAVAGYTAYYLKRASRQKENTKGKNTITQVGSARVGAMRCLSPSRNTASLGYPYCYHQISPIHVQMALLACSPDSRNSQTKAAALSPEFPFLFKPHVIDKPPPGSSHCYFPSKPRFAGN